MNNSPACPPNRANHKVLQKAGDYNLMGHRSGGTPRRSPMPGAIQRGGKKPARQAEIVLRKVILQKGDQEKVLSQVGAARGSKAFSAVRTRSRATSLFIPSDRRAIPSALCSIRNCFANRPTSFVRRSPGNIWRLTSTPCWRSTRNGVRSSPSRGAARPAEGGQQRNGFAKEGLAGVPREGAGDEGRGGGGKREGGPAGCDRGPVARCVAHAAEPPHATVPDGRRRSRMWFMPPTATRRRFRRPRGRTGKSRVSIVCLTSRAARR